MNRSRQTQNRSAEERIFNGFREVTKSGRVKLRQYLLSRAGLASHEIRIDVRADFPLCIKRSDDSFKEMLFYKSALVSSPFCVINTSATSPSISSLGLIARIDGETPLEFVDPRFDARVASWEYDFVEIPKESQITSLEIPTLSAGKYLAVPEGLFQTNVAWSEVLNEYGYHDWLGEKDVPIKTGKSMNRYLEQLFSHIEVWLYVILDSDELLPFRWDSVEEHFVPGFWTDGTVPK